MFLRKTLKHYSIAVIGLLYFISRLFYSGAHWVIPSEYFLFLHTLLEFFSIIVSFTIGLQCLASYPYTKSDRKYLLGIFFITVGLFDLLHTLTYNGMFLNTTGARSIYFSLTARLTESSGLLIYILNRAPKKRVSMVFGSAFLVTALIVIMKWGPYLPPMLLPDGVTSLKIFVESLAGSLNLIAFFVLIYKSRLERAENCPNLSNALLLLLICELFFTIYHTPYDSDNLVGHIFKFLGYTYILKNILIKNLHEPFKEIQSAYKDFNTIFQFAPVGLSIIRKSDHQFLEINHFFMNFLGLPDKDVIGKTPMEVGFSEADWTKVLAYAENNNYYFAETTLANLEISLEREGSKVSIAAISAETIQLGHEECILMSVTDIKELKSLHTEMIRLDRLNLVGQMAAGIAHEIRNPMTTVRGYLQLMDEKSQDIGQKSTLHFMIEELDRANSILKEFLTLAKNNKPNYQILNLNKLLQNLHPLIEADSFTQNKQIRFTPGDIPDIELSPKDITQLVLNLCINGLDAMSEGGCLTIQTYKKDHSVILSIKDEGHGIPKELLEKLGTPFFTTKENGTGLGLSICYKIAKSHNAKIDVTSSSEGTLFQISFPLQSVESMFIPSH
ncbi:MASE3 domain-containing protein [Desulfitobacterium sp. PCE1]|uniref:MASE3 domain-containing protein n=1 Tax=Desulfitobacterium sp. PCE1 TaxID=146907 RepID=UPI000360F987|nr:MASE3 domain-containing protein [Desulfitobacterium sp. PCE1]